MRFLLLVIVAALVAFLERGRTDRVGTHLERALAWRWMPVAVGLVWAALVWWTWGSLAPEPVYHDELAYLFQARLFAEGRWTAPAPLAPLDAYFAQPHLLVAPAMAAKYPPGHSLLLALGELVGAPWIMVLALVAVRAGFTFALARRLTNGAIALGTVLFLVHGDSLHWAASYFSQATTGAMLVVGWYALLRWHEGGPRRWLFLVAFALGWCAITRPFSALLFALPIGFVVLRDVARTRRWRELAVAAAIGATLVAVLPLWSARTTGDWHLWPVSLYTRDYMPFDYPHFGVVAAQPRRELPVDLAQITPSLLREEQRHTVARLPAIARDRLHFLGLAAWWQPGVEAALALIGLLVAPVAIWVGAATALAVFAGYLAHPTWATWTIYYAEVMPVLAFLTVCGLAALLRAVVAWRGARTSWRAVPRVTTALVAAFALVLCLYVPMELRGERRWHRGIVSYQSEFRAAVAQMPGPSILFVRHAPFHSGHFSLISNGPDWQSAPVWVLPDRGAARNADLMRHAPARRGYLYDENAGRIQQYPPAGAP